MFHFYIAVPTVCMFVIYTMQLTYEFLFSTGQWTDNQTAFLKMRFATAIATKRVLKKNECEKVLSEMPKLFSKRKWQEIKHKVRI